MTPRANRMRPWRTAALVVVLCAAPGGTRAQTAERAIEFDDLGFTNFPDVSPRAAALAAPVAAISDATSLVYNPAGLARARRVSATLVLGAGAMEVTTGYGGASAQHALTGYGLQFAGGAVPLPVARGSLVPAVAVYRAFTSDLDIDYSGYNAVDDRQDTFRLQQDGSTFAFTLGAGVDLSNAITAGAAVFLLEGGFDALRQFDYQASFSNTHTYVADDIAGDVGGIGARIGMLLYAHRHLHFGVNFTTPTLVDVDVEQTREETRTIDNDVGSFVRTATTVTTRYRLAQRVDGAVCVPWGSWLVAAQASVSPWEDATIDDRRLSLPDTDTVLGRVVEWRAGVEWTSTRWPLRVRGGVARVPFATRYLQADRVDDDRLEPQIAPVAPLRVSAGGAVVVRRSVTLDASYWRATGERNAETIRDHREWSQFLLHASYWF